MSIISQFKKIIYRCLSKNTELHTAGLTVGKPWKQWLTLCLGAEKSLQMVTAAMKLKDAYSLEGKLWPI